MLKTAFRFLLLRVLPRRLVPILTAIEVIRFVRRLRRPKPVAPRRVVTSGSRGPGQTRTGTGGPEDRSG